LSGARSIRLSLRYGIGLLLPAAALLVLSPPVHAQSGRLLYVSATGNDNNPGSQSAPYRQIRKAVSVAVAGDTVLVGDGSYLGFDMRNKNGTATAPITIKATSTGAVVTKTTDRADNRDTIFVTSSNYIVVEGLRSFNANRAAVRVDASHHVTVRRGVFGNNGTWGIFTNHSDDLLLEYNECYGSVAEHGIYVSNSGDRPTVRGNILYSNTRCGLHMNGDLSAGGGDGIIKGALVENNLVYDNGTGGGAGINMDGVQDSLICNNLIFNNRAGGITAYRIDGGQGPKNNQFLHNTVDMPSTGRWALLIRDTAGVNFVRNNILLHRGSRGGLSHGATSDIANVDSDYNVIERITPNDGTTVQTLAQWQSARSKELHSLSASVTSLFVNPVSTPATADYHLKAGAAAIDRGVSVSNVPTDREGQTRPSGAGVDIGADEYTTNTTPPPTTSATFVSLDTTTQGSWASKYGQDGYSVAGSATSHPGYGTVTFANHSSWTWANPTTELRALTKPGSTERIAACWYNGSAFNIRVNITDANPHRVALYLLDWDNASGGRRARVEAWNTATNVKLGEQLVSNFQNGAYVLWNVQGDVTFKIVALNGNAVTSAVFFDPVAATGGAPSVSASFVSLDTTTRGNWSGVYGTNGYHLAGANFVNPSYGTVTLANHSSWIWANPTTEVRALLKPGSTERISACWYNGSSFTIRVNNTDSNQHQIALYLLDWDNYGVGGRQVRVEAWNTATNTKLAEQVVSGFQNGTYILWNIRGNVTFKIINLNGNAVASGVFFE
jgi:parallel beta-helix repeat protein